ncbi:MAG TPA: preprotein translocase subunit SecE [Acidimicrobiales bacterium]|nr:preprotein translocase subunit SecE [Acidimicrobiales bacterium]
MNRQMKRMMQRQGQVGPDGTPESAPRAPQQRRAPSPTKERTSPGQFLKEVRGELRKVAWPTRAEVTNYSTIVLFTLVVLIALIFVLDLAFAKSILFLFKT